jgi:hypothetical protein
VVFGVSTGFDITDQFILTPGFYHQISMDKTVDKENETWVTLSATYKF